MRLLLFLSFLLAVPAHSKPDPISRLVAQLEKSGGLWVNGVFPNLPYPESVEPELLVREILNSYDWAKDQAFRILEQREVVLDGSAYQAWLLETAAGPKILILRYEASHHWWSKLLDPPQ